MHMPRRLENYQGRPPQHETVRPSVAFIDESSPFQPYVQHGELDHLFPFVEGTFAPFTFISQEGFAHNETRQREVGSTLTVLFNVPKRTAVLDVGWGSNQFIAEAMHTASGVPISLINFDGDSIENNPPRWSSELDTGSTAYTGDIHDISLPGSDLLNAQFGLIMFNGSWVAGGENHTIAELADIITQAKGVSLESENFRALLRQRMGKTLSNLHSHLLPHGIIFVSSSRYAYHGAGYSFSQLPDEKLQFLDFISRTLPLRPRRLIFLGIGAEKIRNLFDISRSDKAAQNIQEAHVLLNLCLSQTGIFNKGKKQLFEDLLHGRSFRDVDAFVQDENQRNAFLSKNPEVHDMYKHELANVQEREAAIVEELTQGVDALPDQFENIYAFDSTHIQEIKEATRLLVPSSIGRIDAVGIEF